MYDDHAGVDMPMYLKCTIAVLAWPSPVWCTASGLPAGRCVCQMVGIGKHPRIKKCSGFVVFACGKAARKACVMITIVHD